ncbi:MAG: hypothetical protein P8123_06920, partial [bacterium]
NSGFLYYIKKVFMCYFDLTLMPLSKHLFTSTAGTSWPPSATLSLIRDIASPGRGIHKKKRFKEYPLLFRSLKI